MKKTKRYQTNLISSIIVLVTLVLLVLLGIMLINHTKLETRFDAIVSMLERIDKAVANLDTEREILVCIAALYRKMPAPDSVELSLRYIGYGISDKRGFADKYCRNYVLFLRQIF